MLKIFFLLIYGVPSGFVNFCGHQSALSFDDHSSAILMQYGSSHDQQNLDRSEDHQNSQNPTERPITTVLSAQILDSSSPLSEEQETTVQELQQILEQTTRPSCSFSLTSIPKNLDAFAEVIQGASQAEQARMLLIAMDQDLFLSAKFIVSLGLDLNTLYDDSETPILGCALLRNKNDFVKLLLQAGVDARAKTPYGSSLLHLCRDPQLIDLLCSCGADINAQDIIGRTPLSNAVADSFNYSKEYIQVLIDHGAAVNILDHDGNTSLHLAIDREDDIFQLLVDQGADLFALNGVGQSSIELAVSSQRVPIVSCLLQAGYSPNVPIRNIYSRERGEHLLHQAVRGDDLEIVQLLIDAGADINIRADQTGNTPLHTAVKEGNLDIVKLLIDSGADVNALNYDRTSPLHDSSGHINQKMTQFLIDSGANVNQCNLRGETPLYCALEKGVIDNFKLLLEYKANPNLTSKGESLLHMIATRFYCNDTIYECLTMAQMLLDHQANIGARDATGATPLHYAVKNYYFLEFLLKHSADPKATDYLLNTPLHYAVRYGYDLQKIKPTIKSLVEAGADLNAQNFFGKTPLHIALLAEKWALAEFLVNIGANPLIQDEDGNSALIFVKELQSLYLYGKNKREFLALLKLLERFSERP